MPDEPDLNRLELTAAESQLEAKLARVRLTAPAVDLYQVAYDAGRSAGRASAWRWRAAACALAIWLATSLLAWPWGAPPSRDAIANRSAARVTMQQPAIDIRSEPADPMSYRRLWQLVQNDGIETVSTRTASDAPGDPPLRVREQLRPNWPG